MDSIDKIVVVDNWFDHLTLKILNDKIDQLQWKFCEVVSESEGNPVERLSLIHI